MLFCKLTKIFSKKNIAAQNYKAGASGACTIIAYILHTETEDYLFVANAGDCRAVVGVAKPNGRYTPLALSRDHTADDPEEVERLQREHPNEYDVVYKGRVKGYLQPSRGIGDGVYKNIEFNVNFKKRDNWHPPYTTADPEIKFLRLTPEHKFLILATDGVWGFKRNEEIVDTISKLMNKNNINLATSVISSILEKAVADGHFSSLNDLIHENATYRRNFYDDTTLTVIKFNVVERPIKAKL